MNERFTALREALTAVLGDAEAAQVMIDDLIEQDNAGTQFVFGNKRGAINLVDNATDVPQAIALSFIWKDTKQGQEYWEDLNEQALAYFLTHKMLGAQP